MLIVLLVLTSCPSDPERTVPEIRALRTTKETTFPEIRARLQKEESTERVHVIKSRTTLRLPVTDVPGTFEFECGVRPLRAKPAGPAALDVQLHGVVSGSEVGPWSQTVKIRMEAGQDWIPLRIPVQTDREIDELRLRVMPIPSDRGTPVAILRPQIRFERTIPRSRRSSPPRQVLLLTLDTLRADVLGCYGNQVVKTPAFDRLSRNATVFRSAFSATNITNPSHVSIFTSLHLKDHGVLNNRTRLEPGTPTMIEAARDAGLKTAAFVAAYNFDPGRSTLGTRFDELSPCNVVLERRAEDVNAELIPWLNANSDEDFLVWAHYFDPHMPYDPPYPFNVMYQETGTGEKIEHHLNYGGDPRWFEASEDAQYYRNQYHGEVSYLDQQIGTILDQLDRLALLDQIMIVVVADHGESLGEHGIYCGHGGLYDTTTRVPMLIKLPGQELGGSVDDLVSTVDIYPTIAETLDLPILGPTRGVSLTKALEAVSAGSTPVEMPDRNHVFSEYAGLLQVSVRTPTHRFTLSLGNRDLFPRFSVREGRTELYHLVSDASETVDISGTEEELERSLEELARRFLLDRLPSSAKAVQGKGDLQKLLQLGYTEDGE